MRQLLLGFLLIAGVVWLALSFLDDPEETRDGPEPFLAPPVMQPRDPD